MTTSTLLFTQNAIKAVKMTEDTIAVYYGDGTDLPIYISSDDELYEYHKANFEGLKNRALKETAEDAGEQNKPKDINND